MIWTNTEDMLALTVLFFIVCSFFSTIVWPTRNLDLMHTGPVILLIVGAGTDAHPITDRSCSCILPKAANIRYGNYGWPRVSYGCTKAVN